MTALEIGLIVFVVILFVVMAAYGRN